VRDLPPAALLAGNAADPQIAGVLTQLSEVDGVIVASPVYKAAYSGLPSTTRCGRCCPRSAPALPGR
jgi:FMN reductase